MIAQIMRGRIVVGVDGSHDADEAVAWAAEQARRVGDELVIVHAYDYPYLDRLDDVTRGELEERANEVVERAAASVRSIAPDVAVHTEVETGRPADVLVDAAENADLLVVGRRGIGRARRWILGSVASKCLHAAPCPVVAVGEPV